MTVDVFSAHRHDEQCVLSRTDGESSSVDMVNEFCKPGGAMVLPGYERLSAPQLAVIEAARAGGAAGNLGA